MGKVLFDYMQVNSHFEALLLTESKRRAFYLKLRDFETY